MNPTKDPPELWKNLMLPPASTLVFKRQPNGGCKIPLPSLRVDPVGDYDPDPDDSMSVATSGGLPALSVYEKHEEDFRREIILENKIPTLFEVGFLCKSCRICNFPKDHFRSIKDGLDHLRTQHFKRRCPKCFTCVSSKGNDYKNHVMGHFINSKSRPEHIECAYCEKICPYQDLWYHISTSHLPKSQRAGKPFEADRKDFSSAMIDSKPSPFKESSPSTISKSLQDDGGGPSTLTNTQEKAVVLTQESVLALCLNPEASITEPNIDALSTIPDRCKVHGRKCFTEEQKQHLRRSFLEDPNPNPSWRQRAENLSEILKCDDLQRIVTWFTNTRKKFVQGNPPKWTQNTAGVPLYNGHGVLPCGKLQFFPVKRQGRLSLDESKFNGGLDNINDCSEKEKPAAELNASNTLPAIASGIEKVNIMPRDTEEKTCDELGSSREGANTDQNSGYESDDTCITQIHPSRLSKCKENRMSASTSTMTTRSKNDTETLNSNTTHEKEKVTESSTENKSEGSVEKDSSEKDLLIKIKKEKDWESTLTGYESDDTCVTLAFSHNALSTRQKKYQKKAPASDNVDAINEAIPSSRNNTGAFLSGRELEFVAGGKSGVAKSKEPISTDKFVVQIKKEKEVCQRSAGSASDVTCVSQTQSLNSQCHQKGKEEMTKTSQTNELTKTVTNKNKTAEKIDSQKEPRKSFPGISAMRSKIKKENEEDRRWSSGYESDDTCITQPIITSKCPSPKVTVSRPRTSFQETRKDKYITRDTKDISTVGEGAALEKCDIHVGKNDSQNQDSSSRMVRGRKISGDKLPSPSVVATAQIGVNVKSSHDNIGMGKRKLTEVEINKEGNERKLESKENATSANSIAKYKIPKLPTKPSGDVTKQSRSSRRQKEGKIRKAQNSVAQVSLQKCPSTEVRTPAGKMSRSRQASGEYHSNQQNSSAVSGNLCLQPGFTIPRVLRSSRSPENVIHKPVSISIVDKRHEMPNSNNSKKREMNTILVEEPIVVPKKRRRRSSKTPIGQLLAPPQMTQQLKKQLLLRKEKVAKEQEEKRRKAEFEKRKEEREKKFKQLELKNKWELQRMKFNFK